MITVVAMSIALAVVAGGSGRAAADTAPAAGTPATVSADALPTVQENGVVLAQVTVGNIVYATGRFTETWPAGSTNTAANDTARGNLLAYNITTGALVTTFNHSLEAQGLAIAASPDGTRVYVGGDFTSVDGVPRGHVAAFDTATGALVPGFAPSISGQVRAITATNTNVYLGGSFTKVGAPTRNSLAAFSASNGALLSWAPSVDQQVDAILLTPDQSEVVIGGAFITLNGANAYGLGAVTTATGTSVPYAANQAIRDYTPKGASAGHGAAILSLRTDGTQIYGSGYSYYEGNFEGTFGLVPDTGVINFVNDCHGDTYDVLPVGSVLYDVSHAHDCSAVQAFPDTNPRVAHHAMAWTTSPSGQYNAGTDSYGWHYGAFQHSTLLDWYPSLTIGSVTGQYQAAWSLTGNASYIALGGEFPTVNGVAQAGLVRFAVSSLAPNKVGPSGNSTALTPTATAQGSSAVQLKWGSTYDKDNQALSYRLYRDGAGPIYTTTVNSTFWQLPTMSFTDTGVAPGSTHSYQVRVFDPFNNTTSGSSTTVTLPGGGGGSGTTATDNFARTVSGGWGTATTGGAWASSSAPTSLNVAPGTGSLIMSAAGTGPSVYLASYSGTSTDTTATITADKLGSGNGISMSVLGRRVSSTVDYRALVRVLSNNTVGTSIESENAGTQTVLAGETALSGVTFTPGLALKVRLQVTGTAPTTLRLKVWPASSTEPSAWSLSATDATAALQAPGSVGFAAYLSGSATNAPVTMQVSSFATAPVA